MPPTESLVNWILTGTDLDPDTEISPAGGVLPHGGKATVRAIAVCLAMAGGRPEYLPLTIACVKAMTDEAGQHQGWNTTTCAVQPAFVVNGPIAKDIRLGSGYGCLGPDALHPTGHIVGRAIRLILLTLGGATPGQGTMSVFGASRAVNIVFAEDEEGYPESWPTLAEERGYKRGQNVVTCTTVSSMTNMVWRHGDEEANNTSLNLLSGMMAAPNRNRIVLPAVTREDNDNLPTGIVVIPRGFASSLESVSGLDKAALKELLWERSKISREEFRSWTGEWFKTHSNDFWENCGDPVPVCPRASQLTITVAGGDQGGHCFWMQPACFGDIVSAEIELPKNWDDLLLDAVIDLGPEPLAH